MPSRAGWWRPRPCTGRLSRSNSAWLPVQSPDGGAPMPLHRKRVEQAGGAVLVPVAPGELVDKITILELKSERLGEPDKLEHVRRELRLLTTARDGAIPTSPALSDLTAHLRAVN